MEEGEDQLVLDRWRGVLPATGGLDLREDLERLPELATAIDLPPFKTAVQQGSYALAKEEGVELELMVKWVHPQGGELGTCGLLVDTPEEFASLEDLHLARTAQGAGLGRLIVGELASLLSELGLSELLTQAYEVGRYAWARCGFDFMQPEDRGLVIDAAAEFAARLGRSPDLSGIEHSWDLAELAGEDVSAADFAKAQGEGMPTAKAPSLRLGQALLLGPRGNEWTGSLDLRPASQGRERLEREDR